MVSRLSELNDVPHGNKTQYSTILETNLDFLFIIRKEGGGNLRIFINLLYVHVYSKNHLYKIYICVCISIYIFVLLIVINKI